MSDEEDEFELKETEVENNIINENKDFFQEKPGYDDYKTDKQHFFAKRYFIKNRYWYSSKEAKPVKEYPRITGFDGGSMYFDYEKRYEVYDCIIKDIDAGTKSSWNQIAYFVDGEGARLVIDVDSDRLLTEDDIQKFQEILRDCLRDYYTNFNQHPIPIFGSKCGPRKKKNLISSAMHFVCHVWTSLEEAKQIIFGYSLRLRSNPAVNMRDIVIDAGIYKEDKQQVSLRFICSFKIDECIICHNLNDERENCILCKGKGQIMSKVAYEPYSLLVGDEYQVYETDTKSIVYNHSIWPEQSERRLDFKMPVGELDYRLQDPKKRKNQELKPQQRRQVKAGDIPNHVYQALEEEVRKIATNGEFNWQHLEIADIRPNKSQALIYVDGNGSTVCQYVKRPHGGGTRQFYFMLKKNGEMTLQCNNDDCLQAHKDPERVIRFTLPSSLCNTIFNIPNTPTIQSSMSCNNDNGNKKSKIVERFQGSAREQHLKSVYGIKN